MTSFRIRRNSWLNFSPLLSAEGFVFWEVADFPALVPHKDDMFYTVEDTRVGRLDLIAFDFYKDADLWWVIALANDILQIPTDVRLNARLRIPAKVVVDDLIGKGPQK